MESDLRVAERVKLELARREMTESPSREISAVESSPVTTRSPGSRGMSFSAGSPSASLEPAE